MKKYQTLLRDFGFDFKGGVIIQRGIKGFTSDRVFGRAKSEMAACERLCPIIREDEFTSRLARFARAN